MDSRFRCLAKSRFNGSWWLHRNLNHPKTSRPGDHFGESITSFFGRVNPVNPNCCTGCLLKPWQKKQNTCRHLASIASEAWWVPRWHRPPRWRCPRPCLGHRERSASARWRRYGELWSVRRSRLFTQKFTLIGKKTKLLVTSASLLATSALLLVTRRHKKLLGWRPSLLGWRPLLLENKTLLVAKGLTTSTACGGSKAGNRSPLWKSLKVDHAAVVWEGSSDWGDKPTNGEKGKIERQMTSFVRGGKNVQFCFVSFVGADMIWWYEHWTSCKLGTGALYCLCICVPQSICDWVRTNRGQHLPRRTELCVRPYPADCNQVPYNRRISADCVRCPMTCHRQIPQQTIITIFKIFFQKGWPWGLGLSFP